ncbi:MAG: hypothetical protein NZ529_06695 [Cytophagaceae bacterium]|nr:hypothetical protein [Cytophagaceae bacterium]MDW8456468.1 hypothetical protein [Cytophagaceae bacterium]
MRPRVIFVNGWQNTPFLELTCRGERGPVKFDFGMAFMHGYMGFDQKVQPSYGQLFQRMGGRAKVPTRIGMVELTINESHKLSSLTLGANIQRFNEFYRPPWLWYRSSKEQFSNYYSNISAKFDNRYIYGGIQGLGIEITELPKQFSTTLLLGKTAGSGFFNNTIGIAPAIVFVGGKVSKSFGRHNIAYNSSNSMGYEENFNNNYKSASIHTITSEFYHNKFTFFSEIGAGRYQNVLVKKDWNPAVVMKMNFNRKNFLKLPFSVQYFYMGRNLYNLVSEVMNSAVYDTDVLGLQSKGAYDITFLPGLVTDLGILTNNRHGVNTDVEFQIRRLKASFGLGWNQELSNEFNVITFEHRNFAAIRSRFAFYVNSFGPYNDLVQFFMRNFERIKIEENPDSISYRKSYNTVNFNLKYKTSVFGRTLYAFNFINCNTVSDVVSPFPIFSDASFFRYIYEEATITYNFASKFHIIFQYGYEIARGNKRTTLGENGNPMNQTGVSKGIGLDYNLNEIASIYIRHTWFDHKDKSFVLDNLKGTETSLEFKIFF